MTRGSIAIRGQKNLVELSQEAQHYYYLFQPVLARLHNRLENLDKRTTHGIAHAHFQRTYALGLAVALILGCILSALDPNSSVLEAQLLQHSKEVILIGRNAGQYRPVGTTFMIICLTAAWAGAASDTQTRRQARDMFMDYRMDLPGLGADYSQNVLETAARRIRLGDALTDGIDCDLIVG
jgi:hypothetical protein